MECRVVRLGRHRRPLLEGVLSRPGQPYPSDATIGEDSLLKEELNADTLDRLLHASPQQTL